VGDARRRHTVDNVDMVFRSILLAATLSTLLACTLARGAAAGDVEVRVGLSHGGLALRAGHAVRVGGETRVVVTVTDARGTGDGWVLRASGGTVSSISAGCASGSTCTLPRTAPTGGDAVLRAGRGSGMGVIALTVSVRGPVVFSVA
jgi:hypothetical protein